MRYLISITSLTLSLGSATSQSLTLDHNSATEGSPYKPYTVSCSSEDLVRRADAINWEERAYVRERSRKASHALEQWLESAWNCSTGEHLQLPTLALALSGGGPKAGLITAGALYELDAREDTQSAVGGLLQSMTYVSALSGGSLTLSGIMGNDFAKSSTMKSMLYDFSYQSLFAAAFANLPTLVRMAIPRMRVPLTALFSLQTSATRLLLAMQLP